MKYEDGMAFIDSNSSNQQPLVNYISAYLLKREADKRWIRYWVVLHGQCMVFYSQKCSGERQFLRGFIEISPRTKCLITERRKYHFPFFVSTESAKYYFKCESALGRHDWVHAIISSSKGLAPLADSCQISFSNRGYEVSPEIENKPGPDFLSASDNSTDSELLSPGNENCLSGDSNPDEPIDVDNDAISNVIVVESKCSEGEQARMFLKEPMMIKDDSPPTCNTRLSNGIPSHPSSRTHSIFKFKKEKGDLINNFLGNSLVSSRPSSSPDRSKIHLSNVPINISNRSTTRSFSRHFTVSAPDIKTLIIDDV